MPPTPHNVKSPRPHPINRTHLLRASWGLLVALPLCLVAASARAQEEPSRQRFAVELNLGRSVGITPYRRDVVFLQETGEVDPSGDTLVRPYLGDELNGLGSQFAMRMLIDDLEVSFAVHSLARSELRLNWRGDRLIQSTRQRPDYSVDDSGVSYSPRPAGTEQGSSTWLPQQVTSRQRARGSLTVMSLGGAKRFYLTQQRLSTYVPVGGGLVLTHISEDAMPYRLGAQLEAGAGASFALARNINLSANGRIAALMTAHYGDREDAARRAEIVGENTWNTLVATMIYATVEIGLTYRFR